MSVKNAYSGFLLIFAQVFYEELSLSNQGHWIEIHHEIYETMKSSMGLSLTEKKIFLQEYLFLKKQWIHTAC